ncbi:hypothetical protein N7493_000082 [Penicillium malachiteum]|uniref:Uncharacterized protein n=1 Tax=Penicillium malachiteum TaxID=1324776 RepID=A0AAD6HVU2_9EURO|nr:hypothetical protein N7493_000082 [Penicillium malachiteum]
MLPIWKPVLSDDITRKSFRNLMMIVWASWFFRADEQFKSATSSAMTRSNGQFNSIGLPIPVKIIGGVLDAMNEARVNAIQNVFSSISVTTSAFIRGTYGCCFECRSIMVGALQLEQHASGFLSLQPKSPYHKIPYIGVVNKMQAFKSPTWSDNKALPSKPKQKDSSPHECGHSSFASIFSHLNSSIQGLEVVKFVVPVTTTLKRKQTDK